MGRRFNIGVACALVPVLLLSYLLLKHEWMAFQGADEAVRRFGSFDATLIAMEKISAERGPMNGVLGEDLPIPAARTILLKRARIESDDRLNRLLDTLSPDRCATCAADYAIVRQLKRELGAARVQVDRLAAMPRAARDDRALESVLHGMFSIVDGFGPVAVSLTSAVAHGDPNTFNCLVIARLAADLREHAGRLGSRFTSALAMRRQLTIDEKLAIAHTHGRIDQLRALIDARMIEHPFLSAEAFAAVNERYFGDGLRYVASVQALAERPSGAGISTGRFAEDYVPTMKPIVGFRDAVLDKTAFELQSNRHAALVAAVTTAGGEALLMIALGLLIVGFRRDVVSPFAEATVTIHAIAAGDFNHQVPSSFSRDDIRLMFDALRVLKANSIERARLEADRARLIEELATMAETDPLTRLLNRRAFEQRARALCRQAYDPSSRIALIMFDIDYFKHVNDTYGHAVGDEALRMVARLCESHFGRSDIVARIGGEEFAVMTRVQSVEGAYEIAERVRQAIAHAGVDTDSGTRCQMTASFGIAVAKGPAVELEGLFKQADGMLYQAKVAGRNRVMVQHAAQAGDTAAAETT
jgi:diguanylate cyclase (GGDEF)-like protein